MVIMPELKPCPFCGGKAALFVNDGVRVFCTKCRAQTKVIKDGMFGTSVLGNATAAVIEGWNKRAKDGGTENGD